MIDEKKLLECLAHDMSCFETDGKKISQLYLRVDDMVRMINGQPKIGGWIPCSERLPEKSNSYLVTKHIAENEDCTEQYETCSEIFWTRDNKWDCERNQDCEWKVIAWQPFPEAYHEQMD